jgi:hypothetical protein
MNKGGKNTIFFKDLSSGSTFVQLKKKKKNTPKTYLQKNIPLVIDRAQNPIQLAKSQKQFRTNSFSSYCISIYLCSCPP